MQHPSRSKKVKGHIELKAPQWNMPLYLITEGVSALWRKFHGAGEAERKSRFAVQGSRFTRRLCGGVKVQGIGDRAQGSWVRD